jgi:hypothetical protein
MQGKRGAHRLVAIVGRSVSRRYLGRARLAAGGSAHLQDRELRMAPSTANQVISVTITPAPDGG